MYGLPTVCGEFTLVDDPELRFTPSGAAVANVRLVANGRRFNKNTNEWEDHGVVWLTGDVWRDYAENVAESLRKGDKVLVTGTLETRSYETSEGEKRQSYDLHIDEIGPTLRFRQVLHSDGAGQKVTREGAPPPGQQSANDPWATQSAQAAANDPWLTPQDEPPF
jgi:single-strand DNA-binding protein